MGLAEAVTEGCTTFFAIAAISSKSDYARATTTYYYGSNGLHYPPTFNHISLSFWCRIRTNNEGLFIYLGLMLIICRHFLSYSIMLIFHKWNNFIRLLSSLLNFWLRVYYWVFNIWANYLSYFLYVSSLKLPCHWLNSF